MIIVPVSLGFTKPSKPINARLSYEQALSQPRRPYKFANVKELHEHIDVVARLYGLPSKLLKAVAKVESLDCKYRVNKHTHDFGCMQISKKTIRLYKWNFETVANNDRINVVAAAIILKDLKKITYKKLGSKWPCSYNVGHRNLPKACAAYLQKIALVSL